MSKQQVIDLLGAPHLKPRSVKVTKVQVTCAYGGDVTSIEHVVSGILKGAGLTNGHSCSVVGNNPKDGVTTTFCFDRGNERPEE